MRSVEKQPLSIALATGTDEETDPRGAAPGVLYAVRNCRIRSTGSLQKRCGTKGITGTTTVPSGTEHCMVNGGGVARPTEHPSFIAPLGDQLISGTSAGDAFNYNSDAGVEEFRGCFSSVLPVRATAVTAGGDAFSDIGTGLATAAATSTGYYAIAYVTQDLYLRTIVRAPDGSTIYSDVTGPVADTVAAKTRIVVVGSTFYLLYWDTTIKGRALTVAGGVVTASSDSVVVSPYTTGESSWDTSSYDGTNWYLIYRSAAAVFTIAQMTGLTVGTTATFAAPLSRVSIWADSTNAKVWVGVFYDAANAGLQTMQYAIYTAGLAVVSALAVLDAIFGGAGANSVPPLFGPCYSAVTPTSALCVVSAVDDTTTISSPIIRTYGLLVSAAGVVSPVATRYHAGCVQAVSKPDAQQRVWCLVTLSSTIVDFSAQRIQRYLLLRFEDAGRAFADVGGGRVIVEAATPEFPASGPALASPSSFHAVAKASDIYAMPLGVVVGTESTSNGSTTESTVQPQLYEYSTETQRDVMGLPGSIVIAGQPTEFSPGREKYLAASMGGVELGFAFAPSILSISATGGGSMSAGTYAYCAVLQWVDALGRRQLSAPSLPAEVTLSAAGETAVTLKIAHCGNTGQRPPAYESGANGPVLLLYRTTNGGANYQLTPTQSSFSWGAPSDAQTFLDTTSDTVLAENEFLYTDGNVLPNVLAPTCRFMAMAEDRLWCGGLWDPTILEASKVRVPQEPLNFTGDASHQVVLPEACTGLAYMDGQVVAFSASAIYLVGGDGPNDQGAGSFLPPRLLTRGVGCINYLSVLETAIGVIFQSAQGIYLLPRGFGAPQYIGIKAQDTMLANPTILSAVATTSSEYRLARFLIAPEGETESETILTFDIDTGNWFVDTYQADDGTYGSFSILGEGPDGCAMVRNTLTSAATPVWYEDETRFYDEFALVGDGFVGRYIETAWMAPFGPAGWGRVNKCMAVMSKEYGASTSADKVVIELEVDTDLSTEALSWSVPAAGESLSYRGFDITRRDCTMVRGIITETSTGVAAEIQSRGPKFLSLSFEVESQGGMRMLTDSERS